MGGYISGPVSRWVDTVSEIRSRWVDTVSEIRSRCVDTVSEIRSRWVEKLSVEGIDVVQANGLHHSNPIKAPPF